MKLRSRSFPLPFDEKWTGGVASVYFTQCEGLLVPLEILLLILSMHPSPAQTASSVASVVGGGFAALCEWVDCRI